MQLSKQLILPNGSIEFPLLLWILSNQYTLLITTPLLESRGCQCEDFREWIADNGLSKGLESEEYIIG